MTPTNNQARFGQIALVGTLLLLSLLTALPTANAAIWTNTGVSTGAASPTGISAVTNGEVVGITFVTAGDAHFVRKDSATATATEINTDITGTDTVSFPQDTHLVTGGTGIWVFCAFTATAPIGHYCWRSSDNGATWTKGASPGGGTNSVLDDVIGSGSIISVVFHNQADDITYRKSTDYGATWGTAIDISDNTGNPATTPTASRTYAGTTHGAATFLSGASVLIAGPYEVHNNGGDFWTTPYVSELSTTLRAADFGYLCGDPAPSTYSAPLTSRAGITASQVLVSGNDVVCAGGSNIPTAPAHDFATATTRDYVAGDGTGRGLVGIVDLTANNNYVYYRQTMATAWSLGLTLPGDTQNYAVAMTPTQSYFIYQNNTFGGDLELAQIATTTLIPTLDSQSQSSWCSNIDSTPSFGYNYASGVNVFTQGANDLSDGYVMQATSGDTNDLAYLGKGWATPGTPYAKVVFRIEADEDTHTSFFRPTFSLDALTPDATTKGNGLDTQAFADHVEAVFEENGALWQITIKYSNAGSTRAQVGAAVNAPFDPNHAHTFSFTVDTRGNGYAMVKDEEGNQVLINRTMSTSGLAGFAAFAGSDPLYSQWFVASGSNAVLQSNTFLDDRQDTPPNDEDSTCIYFTTAAGGGNPVTITGDLGAEPPGNITGTSTSTSSGGVFGVDADNVPAGFTESTFNFFLGLLMMIGIGAGIWFITRSPLMAGIGFGVGYLMALTFGLVPLWPIVAVVVIAAGITFLKLKAGA